MGSCGLSWGQRQLSRSRHRRPTDAVCGVPRGTTFRKHPSRAPAWPFTEPRALHKLCYQICTSVNFAFPIAIFTMPANRGGTPTQVMAPSRLEVFSLSGYSGAIASQTLPHFNGFTVSICFLLPVLRRGMCSLCILQNILGTARPCIEA